jgi:hypothetical protein
MYIVYIGKEKHSAWIYRKGAEKQIEVLNENGYRNDVWFDFIAGAAYEDGQYFV